MNPRGTYSDGRGFDEALRDAFRSGLIFAIVVTAHPEGPRSADANLPADPVATFQINVYPGIGGSIALKLMWHGDERNPAGQEKDVVFIPAHAAQAMPFCLEQVRDAERRMSLLGLRAEIAILVTLPSPLFPDPHPSTPDDAWPN